MVSLRTTAFIIEERIVALEQFLRLAIYRLTHYSTMDAHASQALRRIQMFLDVPEFIDCFHPPSRDDQRELELMIFQLHFPPLYLDHLPEILTTLTHQHVNNVHVSLTQSILTL